MSLWNKHAIVEKNAILLLLGVLVVISIGGLVEILLSLAAPRLG